MGRRDPERCIGSARELRLRSYRVHELWNGAIACRLLRIDLGAPGVQDLRVRSASSAAQSAASAGAQMLANRLEKNLKRLAQGGAARAMSLLPGVRCRHAGVRLCDRSLCGREDTAREHLHVQEYARAGEHRCRGGAPSPARGAGGAAGGVRGAA